MPGVEATSGDGSTDGWRGVGPPMARNPALSGEDQWGGAGTGPVRRAIDIMQERPREDIIRAPPSPLLSGA